MSKRVRVSAMPEVAINETDFAVLSSIARRIGDGGSVASVGQAALAAEIGCCRGTVQNSLRTLKRKGLITVHERVMENGGQLENAYGPTHHGWDVLQAVAEDRARAAASA